MPVKLRCGQHTGGPNSLDSAQDAIGPSRQGRPDARGREEDHHVLHRVRLLIALLGHEGRAEGARGVDGAAVDGDEHGVRKEHCEANGQARNRTVRLAVWVHGRLENHEHQQERHHHLAREGVPGAEAIRNAVGAQAAGLVLILREDGTQDVGTRQGAEHLCNEVQDALSDAHLTHKHEAKGHRAIDLAAAVGAHSVGEGGDGEAKSQGDLEDPCRARLLGDAHRTAAANGNKERHRDVLGQSSRECDRGVVSKVLHSILQEHRQLVSTILGSKDMQVALPSERHGLLEQRQGLILSSNVRANLSRDRRGNTVADRERPEGENRFKASHYG
mmetsp:Transcript_73200/g.101526  ORF Transcript_73200/g.101526 Transcript_73200/m.101526 type:complete len:331 (+) Transcript_73200:25-1017(+)